MGTKNMVPDDGVGCVANRNGSKTEDIHTDGSSGMASIDNRYRSWLLFVEEDVIQGEYGYEPGEFTVYASHWRALYNEGLTPRQAWQRALDGFANARRDADATKAANHARIISEDEAAFAKLKAATAPQDKE